MGGAQGELCLTLDNGAVTSLLFCCLTAGLPFGTSGFQLRFSPKLCLKSGPTSGSALVAHRTSLDLTRLEWIQLPVFRFGCDLSPTVSSGLSLGQPAKRPHMHLSTPAIGNNPAGLHYPVTPCHYSNQQATYGMMAGKLAPVSEPTASLKLSCVIFHVEI